MKTLLISLLLLPSLSFAMVNLKLDSKEGKTEFLAIGNPGFLKINGKGDGPKGDLKIENGSINGQINLDLSSLDTGMGLRNQHMKEKYLQVDKFPQATLTIKDQKIPGNWNITSPKISGGKLQAILKVHGEEKPVTVSYDITDKAQIKANFEMKITDYKVEIPSFMGVTVADKVTVNIESTLQTEK